MLLALKFLVATVVASLDTITTRGVLASSIAAWLRRVLIRTLATSLGLLLAGWILIMLITSCSLGATLTSSLRPICIKDQQLVMNSEKEANKEKKAS